MSKGLECRYREERNKRRDAEAGGSEELTALRAQEELWRHKYMELRRFVDETLYQISVSHQLMPIMAQGMPGDKLKPDVLVSDPQGLVSDSMLLPAYGLADYYQQALPLEGQTLPLFSNNMLLSNPTLGHSLMEGSDHMDLSMKSQTLNDQLFPSQGYPSQ